MKKISEIDRLEVKPISGKKLIVISIPFIIISSILLGFLIMILIGDGPEGGYESMFWGFVFAVLIFLIPSILCFITGIYKIKRTRRTKGK